VTKRARRRVLVLLLLCAAAGGFAGRHRIRRFAKRMRASAALQDRAALSSEEPPFSRLAASQIGYAPQMKKQFSSPRAFASFRVVDERSGAAVFQGGPPVRQVHTDLLGAIDTVWVGDFSALSASGRYRIVADGGMESHPFEVGAGVFDAPLRAVQRWFYYQRAFTAVDAAHAEGPWTHPSDAALAPPGVRKGWHDAGDFSLYTASANAALFWLLEAFSDFAPADDDTNIPESGNGIPDLLDEARWELEWELSIQDASGGFRNTTCQEGYGRYGTNRPSDIDPVAHFADVAELPQRQ